MRGGERVYLEFIEGQLWEQSLREFACPSVVLLCPSVVLDEGGTKEGISHPPQVEDLIIKVIIKV